MKQKFLPWLLLFPGFLITTLGAVANQDDRVISDEPITFTTTGGRTYSGVRVTKITAYSILVLYSAGMAQIDFEELPPHIQQKYHYDPDRAKAVKELKQQQAAAAQAAHAKDHRRYGRFYEHLQTLQEEAVKFTTSSAEQSLSECERKARSAQVRRVIRDHREKLLRIKAAVADLEAQQVTEDQIVEHLDALYHREVFKGMTKEFALMAWGKPDEINMIKSDLVDHEQWRYRRTETKRDLLTIVDGKISEIASYSF